MRRILLLLTIVSLYSIKVRAQVVDTVLNKVSERPFYFSVPVEDGNYKVTVTLGNKKKAAQTVVRAESRRLMVENCVTKKGKFETYSFIVNKRSQEIPGGGKVSLKPRELDYLNWETGAVGLMGTDDSTLVYRQGGYLESCREWTNRSYFP